MHVAMRSKNRCKHEKEKRWSQQKKKMASNLRAHGKKESKQERTRSLCFKEGRKEGKKEGAIPDSWVAPIVICVRNRRPETILLEIASNRYKSSGRRHRWFVQWTPARHKGAKAKVKAKANVRSLDIVPTFVQMLALTFFGIPKIVGHTCFT